MPIIILTVTFFFHVILPIFFLLWIRNGKSTYRIDLLFKLIQVLSFLVLLYTVGRWENLSAYLRTPLTLLYFLLYVLAVFKKWKELPSYPTEKKLRYYTLSSIMPLIFLLLVAEILHGSYSYPGNSTDLHAPLRNSYVGQGGNSVFINYHQAFNPQKYALDLTVLNAWGARANTLFPKQLEDFVIYKDTIFAPCDGPIVKLTDDMEDTPLGGKYTGHPAGNHIVFGLDSSIIVIAHALKNSYFVKEGDVVKKGQPIALVGNSGNSPEPHLHIHSESGHAMDQGKGIPITFNHLFAVRNDFLPGN